MKGILLDLDDTLLDDRKAAITAFEEFFKAHRPSCPYQSMAEARNAWREASARHWKLYELGKSSFQEQRRARVRHFFQRSMTDDEADQAFEPYRIAYEASWRTFDDCLTFFESTKNIPKVIVTNGDRTQQLHKLNTTGIHKHIMGVITPSDCGHWKPSSEIFLAALTALNLAPQQCLMIGDDPIRDIEPALRLGMVGFHVEPGNPDKGLLNAVDLISR